MNAYDGGKCVYATGAANFTFSNTILTQCSKVGMEIPGNNYIDLHNNLIIGVIKRTDISTGPWSSLEITSGINFHEPSSNAILSFTNNII